jgi:hypothetical protein
MDKIEILTIRMEENDQNPGEADIFFHPELIKENVEKYGETFVSSVQAALCVATYELMKAVKDSG